MEYGIINKKEKTYFSGFDVNNLPTWTKDKKNAWKHSKLAAKTQALFLVDFGAQKKPVLV